MFGNSEIKSLKLEIEKLRNELRDAQSQQEKQIENLCKRMVVEIFSNPRDSEMSSRDGLFFTPFEVKTIAGEMRQRVVKMAGEDWEKQYKPAAMEFIEGEDFIDSVVERIKRKQLGSGND